MNKTIKTSNKIFIDIFQDNNIYESYDFEFAKKGDVLIGESFITKFKDFRIFNKNDVKICWFLIDLIKNSQANPNSQYNFTVFISENVIKFEIGNDLYEIKRNIEKYEKYLMDLENYNIESYIEFKL